MHSIRSYGNLRRRENVRRHQMPHPISCSFMERNNLFLVYSISPPLLPPPPIRVSWKSGALEPKIPSVANFYHVNERGGFYCARFPSTVFIIPPPLDNNDTESHFLCCARIPDCIFFRGVQNSTRILLSSLGIPHMCLMARCFCSSSKPNAKFN